MKTMVTGRESIGGMPDLVFAQIGDEEKGELLFRTVPDDNFI